MSVQDTTHTHTHTHTEVQDGPSDLYEEPISTTSSGGRPSTSSSLHVLTPSQSRENSASGAEFIETTQQRVQLEQSALIGDMSMDWGSIYSPIKGDKVKVGTLKSVSIKGLLEKLGGRKQKTWQRRYCVLAGPLMYFYEKESSKTYNNYIVLSNFTITLAPNVTVEKKKQFAFRLSHLDTSTGKKKDYYFRAISAKTRDKWITAIQKTMQSTLPHSHVSATLPRMISNTERSFPVFEDPEEKRRAMSVGDDDGQELYEDVAAQIPEVSVEEEDAGDYLPVSPVHEGTDEHNVEELSSSAEYVDVQPNRDDVEEENYEDTTNFQPDLPPPPLSPPPGPPTSYPPPSSFPPGPPITHPPPSSLPPGPPITHPPPSRGPELPPHDSHSYPSRKPAPPPPTESTIDTEKVYTQGSNGIVLKNVYVVVWNFEAHERDELNLNRGDLVLVSNSQDDGDWWFGELLDNDAENKLGRSGLFPREYADLAFEPMSL